MKNRAKRVVEPKTRRGPALPLIVVASLIIAVTTGFAISVLKGGPPETDEHRAPAGSRPAAASFAYERSSDLGDKIRYAIECPGIPLCSVEISENGKPIGKAQIKWETIELFFVHYSGSALMKEPKKAPAAPARTLVRYMFKMSGVEAAGVISDQSEFRRVIPYWDAMFVSFM